MKRILFALLFAWASCAVAQPYLYADTVGTSVTLTTCGVFMDAQPKTVAGTVLVGTIVTCKHDLSGITGGSHTVRVTAIVNDPIWGPLESVQSLPFTFTKPSTLAAPTGLRLGL
jgi:hypothetical protein